MFMLVKFIIAAHTKFLGVTGKLMFDSKGDRKMNFATLRFDPQKGM